MCQQEEQLEVPNQQSEPILKTIYLTEIQQVFDVIDARFDRKVSRNKTMTLEKLQEKVRARQFV